MADIRLSDRMQAVADMLDTDSVADIGCDHAFVSIYLKKVKNISRVIAMDIKDGPLDIARENIKSYGLSNYIEVRSSDGFDSLKPGEAETAIIAGMGGMLMVDLLKRGKAHTDLGIELVLQPQSELEKVRLYLQEIDYRIADEKFLIEDGKYYTVIKAVKTNNTSYKAQEDKIAEKARLIFGPVLLERKDELLRHFIIKEKEKNEQLISRMECSNTEKSMLRAKELKAYNKIIASALDMYQ